LDPLFQTFRISAAGMKAQGVRLRAISENVANAQSKPAGPGEVPYQRKLVTFKNSLDRATGLDLVEVDRVRHDMTPFPKAYDPGHPAADADGYVLQSNVSSLIEMMDMREAQRSYEANLSMIKTSKAMVRGALDILR
jgi:flagellar basal-body rod protein FlgC